MKLLKRAAMVLVFTSVVSGSLSCIYAGEMGKKIAGTKVVKVLADSNTTTGSGIRVDDDAPTIKKVYTEVRSGKTYLMISVTDATGIRYVKVEGENADRYSGDKKSAVYSYEISSGGTYDIDVCDEQGNSDSTSKSITLSNKKPSVSLSQSHKNSKYYLVIKASDDGKIKKVTVNGSSISFDEKGETKEYQVTKAGKYTVVVTDDSGNETTESYTVDMDTEKPSLDLTKEYKDGKWYLRIKVSPAKGNKLSKVTVNSKSLSFKSTGDVISYEVTSTGRYEVIAKDDMNVESSAKIYVDVDEVPDTQLPQLSLSQLSVGGMNFIVIKAQDNDKVAKITVNGEDVSLSSFSGTIRYQVASSGNYTVTVTDTTGNKTEKILYVTVNGSASGSAAGQTVKFKLNDKNWTKDGVKQTAMDTPPLNKNGRIYLPIRYAAYALGIDSSKITWDAKSQSAVIYDGSNVVKVTAGSKTMIAGGREMTMEAVAFSQNGRVFLPISQVSKAFAGMSLNWDNTAKEITITRTK